MSRRVLVSAIVAAALLVAPNFLQAQTEPQAQPAGPRQETPPATSNPTGATPAPSATTEQIIVRGRPYQNKVIQDFVKSYAAPVQNSVGQLARWKAGVCPFATGLPPAFNKFVTDRVRAVAAMVGAPVDAKAGCRPNLEIVFSPFPQAVMDALRKKAAWVLGSHYLAQEKDLATMRYPIQAWYATETEDDNGAKFLDDIGGIVPSNKCTLYVPCSPGSKSLCPIQVDLCAAARGSHISLGFKSEFLMVTVVVDNAKIVGSSIGALSDYISLLALAQTKSFDGCRELPSIANLMTDTCDASKKAEALTANDVAYLRALYQMDPTVNADLQKPELASWMKKNLEHPQ